MAKKFICPYCYEKHTEKECKYTCSYTIKTTLGVKSCKYDEGHKENGLIKDKFIGKCKKCHEAKLFMYCPTKHEQGKNWEIPERARGDNFSIALIGAKQSGKSNYIAVLVNEIKKKMARSMECALMFCNQDTSDAYQNTYYKPLYESATTVKGTDANVDSKPLIYSIDFFDGKSKSHKIKNSITLSLYDTAGENLDKESTMLCNNQYIANANGIIVLLDPLQIPAVRKKLEGKMELPEKNSDITDILSRVIEIIRARKKVKGSIDIPIALAFTKMDVLARYDIIPQESCLREESEHLSRGAFIQSDFEATGLDIEALLENFMADEVVQFLKSFSSYACFGLSALGENPVGGVKLSGDPNPVRVLDPLLWLLAINKYIKTA